jgi:hypothetical protein
LSEKSGNGSNEPVVVGCGSFLEVDHFVLYGMGTGDGFEVVGEEEGFLGFIVFEQVVPRNGGGGSFGTDAGGLKRSGGTHCF